jgi:hypothetical protein
MIQREIRRAISGELRDNFPVRQLSMFTRAEIAAMRDRSASRNYSPSRDAFRQEHERHRSWGKARRHDRRLRQLAEASGAARAGGLVQEDFDEWVQDPWPALARQPAPHESAVRESAARGRAACELAAREWAATEATARESAAGEWAACELAARESAAREAAIRGWAARDAAVHEAAPREMAVCVAAARE